MNFSKLLPFWTFLVCSLYCHVNADFSMKYLVKQLNEEINVSDLSETALNTLINVPPYFKSYNRLNILVACLFCLDFGQIVETINRS